MKVLGLVIGWVGVKSVCEWIIGSAVCLGL